MPRWLGSVKMRQSSVAVLAVYLHTKLTIVTIVALIIVVVKGFIKV